MSIMPSTSMILIERELMQIPDSMILIERELMQIPERKLAV
jgi:hypothetical protein